MFLLPNYYENIINVSGLNGVKNLIYNNITKLNNVIKYSYSIK